MAARPKEVTAPKITVEQLETYIADCTKQIEQLAAQVGVLDGARQAYRLLVQQLTASPPPAA